MKLTYSEQLTHPKWQKLRLEILSAANFKCQLCEDDDETLHVHHKSYIKGRMAWEYELSNFEALCKRCHLDAHSAKDSIANTLTSVSSGYWPEAASILIGWSGKRSEPESEVADFRTEAIGRLAYLMSHTLSMVNIENIQAAIEAWDPLEDYLDIRLSKCVWVEPEL